METETITKEAEFVQTNIAESQTVISPHDRNRIFGREVARLIAITRNSTFFVPSNDAQTCRGRLFKASGMSINSFETARFERIFTNLTKALENNKGDFSGEITNGGQIISRRAPIRSLYLAIGGK